jgi:hypothetical protein
LDTGDVDLDLERLAGLRIEHAEAAPSDAHIYNGVAPANRPAGDYTVRIIPRREGVVVPTELPLILWQK